MVGFVCAVCASALMAAGGPEKDSVRITLLRPAFNQSFYSSNPEKDVAVTVTADLSDESRKALVIRLSLSGSDGRDLGAREVRGMDGPQMIVSVPRPPLQDGEKATVACEALLEGKTVRKESWVITQLPRAGDEVVMRDDGVTLVNGQPFFPYGMYQSPVSEFAALKKMGFNTVHTYKNADAAYMKAAEESGLRVIASVDGVRSQAGNTLANNRQNLSHEVRDWDEPLLVRSIHAIKDSPALLTYYLFDEPSPGRTTPETLRFLCEVPRRVDPYHLVAGCNNDYQAAYGHISDAMMVDGYPVPGPMGTLISRMKDGVAAQSPRQAVWFIPQAFGWEPYFGGHYRWHVDASNNFTLEGGRLPTFDEVRTMPWLAVTLGAKGLIYYSWQVQGFYVRDAYPIFWKGFEHHVNEMTALFPWLLEREPEQPAKSSDPRVMVTTRQRGDELFIVAVNSDLKPVQARITVPGLSGLALSVVSEKRTVTPDGDSFDASFLGVETHIFTTLASSVPELPTLQEIRAEQSRLQADFDREHPSVCTFRQGGRLYASWGFPEPPKDVNWASWYRMIDGEPNTPWVVGTAFSSEELKDWDQKDFSSPGRWIEVRMPKAREINLLRAIVSPDVPFDLRVWSGGEWRTVEAQKVVDTVPRNIQYASAVTTARFPAVTTDRFRIVFTAPKQKEEVVFELSAAEQ